MGTRGPGPHPRAPPHRRPPSCTWCSGWPLASTHHLSTRVEGSWAADNLTPPHVAGGKPPQGLLPPVSEPQGPGTACSTSQCGSRVRADRGPEWPGRCRTGTAARGCPGLHAHKWQETPSPPGVPAVTTSVQSSWGTAQGARCSGLPMPRATTLDLPLTQQRAPMRPACSIPRGLRRSGSPRASPALCSQEADDDVRSLFLDFSRMPSVTWQGDGARTPKSVSPLWLRAGQLGGW